MTTRLLVGDVFERMTQLEDHSFDFIVTSPPFGWLRSYLPADHPQKHLEIGSEPNPAAYLDVLLALTAEWRRLLAPHGSLAIELGDTYAGSGGAGGDYEEEGLRDGQPKFRQGRNREGWPLPKSLCFIPELYGACLAYGRNLLTGQESPAGQWRIRNLKPWIRTNPPVGALGDKERPATSYITVACVGRDRWFDLDAVRTGSLDGGEGLHRNRGARGGGQFIPGGGGDEGGFASRSPDNAGGAPPLDWWHQVDAIIDNELQQRAGKPVSSPRTAKGAGARANSGKAAAEGRGGQWSTLPVADTEGGHVGARGWHIRRRLEQAGYLTTLDALDISPRGYTGAHYAVWPPELVRQLIDEMCPRFVCPRCGPIRSLESQDDATSLRGVRRADQHTVRKQSDRSETPVLFESVRDERQVGSQTSRDASSGISPRESSIRVRSDAPTGSSDGEQGGGIVRTPVCDGGASGANVDGRRGRPPQERDSGRQPHREPRTDDTASSLESAGTEVEAEALSSLWRDGVSDKSCPTCGAALRRGIVLDPFVGSGTTLAVASGMGRDSVGIDIDERNAHLAQERVGMFLEVDWGTQETVA